MVTCSSVACVVCIHTVHRPLAVLLYTHAFINTSYFINVYHIKLYIFMCQLLILVFVPNVCTILLQIYEDMLCIFMVIIIYINTEFFSKPILTHVCVWIVCSSARGLYTTCSSARSLYTTCSSARSLYTTCSSACGLYTTCSSACGLCDRRYVAGLQSLGSNPYPQQSHHLQWMDYMYCTYHASQYVYKLNPLCYYYCTYVRTVLIIL